MSAIEQKRLAKPFRAQIDTASAGSFSGHGSVFDDPHPTSSWALPEDWQDIVRPGAFKQSLAEYKRSGTTPAMHLQHATWDLPIGVWTSAAEDEDGLALEGKLATTVTKGAEVYELMKLGALTGLSIGFKATKVKLDDKTKIREILAVDLYEVSVVTTPGNDSARITDVKSADPAKLKRFLEDALRDAGLSRTEAKAFVADGFKALRDAGADPTPQLDSRAFLRGILTSIT